MSWILHPTNVLKLGGAVLVLLGVVGATGITNSWDFFNLDAGENVAHIGLGVVGLAVGFGTKDERIHRGLVAILAVTGLAFGIGGFLLAPGSFAKGNFLGLANLENPSDNVLHLVVGIWTAASALTYRPRMAMETAKA